MDLLNVILGAAGSVASLLSILFVVKKESIRMIGALAAIFLLTGTSSWLSYSYYEETNKEAISQRQREELRKAAAQFVKKYPSFTNYWNEGQNAGIANSGLMVLEMYKDLFPDSYARLKSDIEKDIEYSNQHRGEPGQREAMEGAANDIYVLMEALAAQ